MSKLKKWKKDIVFRKNMGTKNPVSYPNEMLVKLCSSKYYSKLNSIFFNGKKLDICEVGCLGGNNLRFFNELNHNVHGIEVNKSMIDVCKNNLIRLGYDIKNFELKVGHNLLVPFKKKFDVIVSINTIHYCVGREIDKFILYLKKKLKNRGILIIETVAPQHEVLNFSKKKSKNNYIFNYPNDFRSGQLFGFFDNKKHLSETLKKKIKKFEIFSRVEDYGNKKKFHFFQTICLND